MAALGAACAYDAALLAPYTPLAAQQQVAASCPGGNRLRLLEANVQMTNRHDHRLLNIVRRAAPDVAWFQETDARAGGPPAGPRIGPGLTLVSLQVLPAFGSDHHPFLAELCFDLAAASRQPLPALRAGDIEAARAAVRKGQGAADKAEKARGSTRSRANEPRRAPGDGMPEPPRNATF